MRDIAILTFVTLDGVMQAPADPSEDRFGNFQLGGWAAPCWPEVMRQVRQEAMSAPYDLLLGRKTYEIFAPYWSEASEKDNPDAGMLNDAAKYVATNTLTKLTWKNSIPIRGNIAAEVARLKQRDGPLLQVHGSWKLIQLLLAHDLIDEFRLWIFPIVLGSGKRLFEPAAASMRLTLIKSAPTGNGVVMHLYRRDRS